MLKFNPTTPIQIYYKDSTYVVGEGDTTIWQLIESKLTEENRASVFYCEWKGSHGDRAITAQSIGYNDTATIRTFYNPDIYSKLKGKHCVIVKNADQTAIKDGEPDKNNQNVYQLWGGVDNVHEENQFMEFIVRRYEGV